MTTPTFADADAALAKNDYEAALSILERIDVVGEDACYRRDIQAAACADRLRLYPLCEEYATRAHSYGDDMADPFALMARAQRRQGLASDAAATASSGARIHPNNPAIARELALALVALGRYEEARGPADLATDTYRNDIELLMAYGRVWEPVNPDAAQWAFRLANKLNPDCEEAKTAYDSLLRPLRGAGRSSYQIEIQPPVAAAYRTMLRRVRAVVTTAGKFAAASGVCCLLFYVGVARSLFPGARWGSSCSTLPPSSAFAHTWLPKSPCSTEPFRQACDCPSCASAGDSPSCAPKASPACTPSSSSASSSSAS